MVNFGDFSWQCKHVTSYPWCNLFFNQLQDIAAFEFGPNSSPTSAAPVGINPECGIPKLGTRGTIAHPQSKSLGNIAQIVASGLSIFLVLFLIITTSRRKAAVGRIELRVFLSLYLLTLPLQLITTSGFLTQGTTVLTVITAIHAGTVAALFWSLFANALVATQIVEDGTLSSLVPFHIFNVLFFAATTYISLDVAFRFTSKFAPDDDKLSDLNSIVLFVLTTVWPGFAALVYLIVMTYVVLVVLRERRPMLYYGLSALLFILSQLAFFLLGKVVCKGADRKLDGAFIATILETASVAVLYLAWRSITEESWDDDNYYPRH